MGVALGEPALADRPWQERRQSDDAAKWERGPGQEEKRAQKEKSEERRKDKETHLGEGKSGGRPGRRRPGGRGGGRGETEQGSGRSRGRSGCTRRPQRSGACRLLRHGDQEQTAGAALRAPWDHTLGPPGRHARAPPCVRGCWVPGGFGTPSRKPSSQSTLPGPPPSWGDAGETRTQTGEKAQLVTRRDKGGGPSDRMSNPDSVLCGLRQVPRPL